MIADQAVFQAIIQAMRAFAACTLHGIVVAASASKKGSVINTSHLPVPRLSVSDPLRTVGCACLGTPTTAFRRALADASAGVTWRSIMPKPCGSYA